MSSTDLVKAADLDLPVLQTGAQAALHALQENLGGETLTAGDLDRVKVPSGGGTKWEVPVLGDTEHRASLDGVIVFQRLTRAYWTNPNPTEGTPPDCSSPDATIGYGTPGDALRAESKGCAECPMSAFGSAPGDKQGQACKLTREVYLLTTESDPLPVLLNVPPTSLGPVRKFLVDLAKRGQSYYSHRVQLTLDEAVNAGGQKYAKVKIRSLGQLDDQALTAVREYAAATEGVFARRPPATATTTAPDGDAGGGQQPLDTEF